MCTERQLVSTVQAASRRPEFVVLPGLRGRCPLSVWEPSSTWSERKCVEGRNDQERGCDNQVYLQRSGTVCHSLTCSHV